MSHEAKTNFILFIIVIFLSLIAWFQPGLQRSTLQYLSALKAEEIHTISIERKGLDKITLKKIGAHWFLQEPFQLPANPLRVNTITALAEKRSYTQFKASESELARYQLDQPSVSTWLNDKKFILGTVDPIKQHRYAMQINDEQQPKSNTVHLINGIVFYQLRAALDTFISPFLLPPEAKVKKISWLNNSLTLATDGWRLTPATTNVGPDSIAQLVQFWKQTQASTIETNFNLTIDDQELVQNRSIFISFVQAHTPNKIDTIQYVIIQDGEQIKLLRPDLHVAYWISPQILKLLTEFYPPQTLTTK